MTTTHSKSAGSTALLKDSRFDNLNWGVEPLGYEAGDANLRRYVGNGVLATLDPNGLKNTLPKHLVGVTFNWTLPNGKKKEGKLIGIEDGNVTIDWGGSIGQKTNPIEKIPGKEDRDLINRIINTPPNIIVDPSSAGRVADGHDKEDFIRTTYEDLEDLGKTDAGKGLLEEIKHETNPITIGPQSGEDNKIIVDNGKKTGTIHYNPWNETGDAPAEGPDNEDRRRRPPYVALAKELFIGLRAIRGVISGNGPHEGTSRDFENELRKELGLPQAANPYPNNRYHWRLH